MSDKISYRTMYYEELNSVCAMVLRIFDEHTAPLVPVGGRASFAQYILPIAMERRLKRGNFVLVAVAERQIVGMIEIREHKHIALLFVENPYQRQGIAKKLIDEALAYCLAQNPNLKEITVNASVNALGFYEKFGFQAYDEPANELYATPMLYKISAKK